MLATLTFFNKPWTKLGDVSEKLEEDLKLEGYEASSRKFWKCRSKKKEITFYINEHYIGTFSPIAIFAIKWSLQEKCGLYINWIMPMTFINVLLLRQEVNTYHKHVFFENHDYNISTTTSRDMCQYISRSMPTELNLPRRRSLDFDVKVK